MEGKRVWTKEDTFLLISVFEGYPELWQIKSKSYRDRVKKQNALKCIADKFDTTEAEIRRKLHNLRTQANQEWNKIKKRKSGQGTINSSWEYYEAMKFVIVQNGTSGCEDNFVKSENIASTSVQRSTEATPKAKKCTKRKRSCTDIMMLLM